MQIQDAITQIQAFDKTKSYLFIVNIGSDTYRPTPKDFDHLVEVFNGLNLKNCEFVFISNDYKIDGFEKSLLHYECRQSPIAPDSWLVEVFKDDFEKAIYTTVFSGSDAEIRANEYVNWKNGSYQEWRKRRADALQILEEETGRFKE